jgi:hypothetical protein
MKPSNNAYRNQVLRIARAIVIGIVIAFAFNLLVGCTSAPVKIEVSPHIPIDCGPAPAVQRLALKDVEPIAAYDPETNTAYFRILVPDYEDLAINNERIASHFSKLSVVIRHYTRCIEDFNANRTTKTGPNERPSEVSG